MSKPALSLPESFGSLLDRRRTPLAFTFAGKSYEGLEGDTIATALARNGVRLFSRSFKYHRPRGIASLNGLDSNLLVQVDCVPNIDAGSVALRAGMRVAPQNYLGSLSFDLKAAFGLAHRALPAGFYYRRFYRPTGAWERVWEPFFRRQAGLGRVHLEAPRTGPTKRHAFFDCVVVGGGACGIEAAISASRSGESVLLVERNPALGGALNYLRGPRGREAQLQRRRELLTTLESQPNVTVWNRALCNGVYSDGWLAIIRDGSLHKVRCHRTVISSGGYDQPIIFRNNDLPGVMLGATAQRLVELYGVRPGRVAVVVTSNDSGYGVASTLVAASIDVRAILDLRPRAAADRELLAAASASGIGVVHDAHAVEALAAFGRKRLRGVRYAADGVIGRQLHCDLLCSCGPRVPAYHLQSHADPSGSMPPEVGCSDGIQAEVMSHPLGMEFVDLDEDVTIADVHGAMAYGYAEIELLKRYTTIGMGASQGRHSAHATALIRSDAEGRPNARQASNPRPPLFPEPLGILAGRPLQTDKIGPLHDRNFASGAVMTIAARWLRPDYYETSAGREASVRAEISACRTQVGLIDVSPLGKIELRGPDSAELLDRLYTLSFADLSPGRTRYLLLTDEAGRITDDGVAYRISPDHFHVTTTTSAADRTFRWMLRWNAAWKLDVSIINLTEAFAGINVAGPASRTLLTQIESDVDWSPGAFPYLAGRIGRLGDVPVRILRIGFVGELGYEIHCPAEYAEHLWDTLLAVGSELGVRPLGLQALRTLRLEKGHIIVGHDTDGLTWPDEARMSWAVSRKKSRFVGKHAIEFLRCSPLRRVLALFTLPPDRPVPPEGSLIALGSRVAGSVTSIARSPSCDLTIGMGYVLPELAAPGGSLEIVTQTGIERARVVAEPFYDPTHRRQDL
jgi:sarcosine oxidase subunit alpha